MRFNLKILTITNKDKHNFFYCKNFRMNKNLDLTKVH